ncbi:hypothetical protein F4777DRAFT_578792 [Nemania sp. FL0916]|nr:hypothetical protein F4777DRAFT_578792 [Nemania sp. FL0916]
MCKRIITHHMHHDVATPIIIDPLSHNPTVYANPLRTNFHRCELSLPSKRWLLNTPLEKCPYHSCCLPHTQIVYCPTVLAYMQHGSSGSGRGSYGWREPEECFAFALEHHHMRLPYFGDECAYSYHHNSYSYSVPATWRGLANLRDSGWDPDFVHHGRAEQQGLREKWEEFLFAECEKLHILTQDFDTLFAAVECLPADADWGTVRAARNNVLRCEAKLVEKKSLVADMLQWAAEYQPYQCDERRREY